MTEIDAYIYGKKIGTLIENEGRIYFQYCSQFIAQGLELSPIKVPLSKELYSNRDNFSLYQGMAGLFFDSLPDKHGMPFIERYFEAQGLKRDKITLLHKLAFIGDRGMGAIEYRPQEHDESLEKTGVINAQYCYEEMKNSMENNSSSITSFMNVVDSVSPVGGGRPKMLVQYNQKEKKFKINSRKLPQGYKRAILKFDESYDEAGSIGLTKLEFIMMSIAKEAGVKVAEFELIEESGLHHLLLTRFDRTNDDQKIHMLTASALMHIDISVAQVTSYEHLISLTQKITQTHEDVEEMFRRMVVNLLTINFDDHAKNFAFLMNKQGEWRLSPAYDITYSKGLASQHLTTIGGKALNVNRADVLKIAKSYAIKLNVANKIIDKAILSVKTFEERAKALKFEVSDIEEYMWHIEEQIELLQPK